MYMDNQRCAAGLREHLASTVPDDAIVLVASGGSDEMLRLGNFTTWHFPRAEDGSLAPNPGNAPALIATVGHLQLAGATHLLFPKRARWWLDLYPPFDEHLRGRHTVVSDDDNGVLFALTGIERRRAGSRKPAAAQHNGGAPEAGQEVAKVIAFYLPQYHPIPENDRWWGSGFTEWTNVTKASPLFDRHDQPRVPSELGFCDLRVAETRRRKRTSRARTASTASATTTTGSVGSNSSSARSPTCSRQETPTSRSACAGRTNPGRDVGTGAPTTCSRPRPTRPTTTSPTSAPCCRRSRITAIYASRASRYSSCTRRRDLPDPGGTVARGGRRRRGAGLPGLYLMTVETGWDAGWDATEVGFDAKVLFQPQFSLLAKTPRLGRRARLAAGLRLRPVVADARLAAAGFVPALRDRVPSWDNSPRRGSEAVVVHNSTPEAYGEWLRAAIERAVERSAPEPLVFVNAWNEWGEGAHLEPDVRHGRAYLEATRRAARRRARGPRPPLVRLTRSLRAGADHDVAPRPRVRVLPAAVPPDPGERRVVGARASPSGRTSRRPGRSFAGHYQPHLPGDLGFYDLRVPEAARGAGGARRRARDRRLLLLALLVRRAAAARASVRRGARVGRARLPLLPGVGQRDLVAALDGRRTRTCSLAQAYSLADDLEHARWLARAFAAPRYVRIGNRPVFLVYRPRDLPSPRRTTDTIRREVVRAGDAEPFLLGVTSFHHEDFRAVGFDGTVAFEPAFAALPRAGDEGGQRYDYTEARRAMRDRTVDFPTHPCIMVGWDNTPRRGADAIVLTDSTPERFEDGLREIVDSVADRPRRAARVRQRVERVGRGKSSRARYPSWPALPGGRRPRDAHRSRRRQRSDRMGAERGVDP